MLRRIAVVSGDEIDASRATEVTDVARAHEVIRPLSLGIFLADEGERLAGIVHDERHLDGIHAVESVALRDDHEVGIEATDPERQRPIAQPIDKRGERLRVAEDGIGNRTKQGRDTEGPDPHAGLSEPSPLGVVFPFLGRLKAAA